MVLFCEIDVLFCSRPIRLSLNVRIAESLKPSVSTRRNSLQVSPAETHRVLEAYGQRNTALKIFVYLVQLQQVAFEWREVFLT